MGIIAKYKFNQNVHENFLPIFSDGFTYTITDKIDTDGFTMRTIESDSLPTLIRFGDSSGIYESIGTLSLLKIDYVNIHNGITTFYNFLANARNLISINTNGWDTSGITDMYCAFYNCSSLTSLDLSNFNTSKVTSMRNMFVSCSSLTSLDLSNFNTSIVASMDSMFSSCSSLTSLDVSNFDTSKVTDMGGMFSNCSKLTSLDVSNFDTGKVNNMGSMFLSCSSLTSLDISNFNTSSVTDMGGMFQNCSSLTSLDVSNFNTSQVTNMSYIFSYCSALTSLDISNFNTSNVANIEGMFNNCFKITDIGTIYCNSDTINKIVNLLSANTTIWYQDAKLSDLTPLSKITYKEYKYVEVQQDVDSIPLTSDMFEQKNINGNDIVKGMSYQQIAKYDDNTRISSKTIIPVKPNTTYSILNNTNIKLWYTNFDKNGGFICNGVDVATQFTTTSDTHYIAAKILYADDSTITPSDLDSMNLILQEVPQEIVLRGIGDVKDTLNLTTGEHVQRIGELVLDGSAYWDVYRKDYHGVGKSTFQVYCTRDIPKTFLNDKIYCDILCQGDLLLDGNANVNKYPCNYIHNYTDGTYTVSRLFVSVNKEMFGCTSNDDYNTCFVRFKEWLKDNPITVQYRLATPIIHKVNLTNTTKLPSYASTTHYDTIVPSNSLIPTIKLPSTIDYNVAIKPSTQYTVRCNTTDALSVDLGGAIGTLSNGKVTLTTPATLTHNEVKFSGTGKVKELMVVEGNEIKDNVPFFNGMKDVQMGGIKLVNIARGASIDDSGRITVNTNETQFTYTNSSSTDTGTIIFAKELVKPNTLYTIYCKIPTNTIDKEIKIQVCDGEKEYLNIPKNYTGVYKALLTSPQELKHSIAIYFRSSPTLGQVVIQNPMVIEGDWTHLDEIPYIESEMIIDQPIIRSQGKNLLDLSQFETATDEGKEVVYIGDYIPNIKFKENTQYIVNFTSKYREGYATKVKIKHTDGSEVETVFSSTTFTKSSIASTQHKTVQYIQFWQNVNDTELNCGVYVKNETWIEEYSTATSYEPYKHQTLYSNRVIGYEEGVHYGGITGIKSFNPGFNSVMADVEGLSIAYVTNGSSNFSFWDKDMVFISGKSYLDTSLSTDNKNGFIQVPSNAKYMKFASANTIGSATDYTKATVTGELPLRSLPNGVCDTLNLVTGEYVQRVGEVVLDGSQELTNFYDHSVVSGASGYSVHYRMADISSYVNYKSPSKKLICNKLKNISHYDMDKTTQDGITSTQKDSANLILIKLPYDYSPNPSLATFKQYLSQNPITVQYELATPIVRKLGFTAKGNYKEITLNGATTKNILKNPVEKNMYHISPFDCAPSTSVTDGLFVIYGDLTVSSYIDYPNVLQKYPSGYELIIITSDDIKDANMCRQWLSQNPFTIGYIKNTLSSTSYSNIHKPIFFNNVDVQFLPHNLDIQPKLTYQVRTRNSYVMDMMKANTKYSVKLLSSSGNMTIDGTSYALANNRTFISPSTLTNKELIISGQWYEPMIIEGDVTGKNLPYFKGILSSYHDVDEIELCSVTDNVFDGEMEIGGLNVITGDIIDDICMRSKNFIKVHPNTPYYINCSNSEYLFATYHYDENYNFIRISSTIQSGQTIVPQGHYIKIRTSSGLVQNDLTVKIWITETQGISYIPHAHNTTLIEMPTRLETVKVVRPELTEGALEITNGAECASTTEWRSNFIPVQPNEFITVRNGSTERSAHIDFYDVNKNFISYSGVVNATYVPDNCYFIRFFMSKTNSSDLTIIRQAYKPIQLNSLPNGVCDEIIMKPNSNKAQLVQRVGKVVLDGSEDISTDSAVMTSDYTLNEISTYFRVNPTSFTLQKSPSSYNGQPNMLCDSLVVTSRQESQQTISNSICIYNDGFGMRPENDVNNAISLRTHLQQNPITVYYELTTPIIHEIQLKGYPHVYENGTVTLNTDVPHQTLVSYNVNQEQLISNQNETIIRHDQQIDDLYYYIELYLEEIYQMELFRMKLELSL